MKPEEILKTLAGIQTWEDKCRVEAREKGLSDPAEIESYLAEMAGDQPDDFLMDFHAEMRDLIEAARNAINPNPVAHLLNKTPDDLGHLMVTSDLDLSDEQKWRVLCLVFNDGKMDANLSFEAQGEIHTLTQIHFQGTMIPGIHGGDSKIEGIDDLKFADTAFIYLEVEDGRKFGWNACQPHRKHEWHYGVVFKDELGQTWACSVDEPNALPGGDITGEEPLSRIEVNDKPMLNAMNGPSDAIVPFEGEFYIETDPETGVKSLGSITWGTEMNPDNPDLNKDYVPVLRATLERLNERARECSRQDEPAPEDDMSPGM